MCVYSVAVGGVPTAPHPEPGDVRGGDDVRPFGALGDVNAGAEGDRGGNSPLCCWNCGCESLGDAELLPLLPGAGLEWVGLPGVPLGAGEASVLVGARTARVTMEARLGPCWALLGRWGAVVGSGGNAAPEPAGLVAAGATLLFCCACSASTLGGGWKFGVGRGRTLLGR